MSKDWGDYYEHQQMQLAMLLASEFEDGTVLPARLVRESAVPVVTGATGSGAINTTYAPGAAFWFDGLTLVFNNAAVTSQNLLIILDAKDGAGLDPILGSLDLSEGGTSWDFVPEGGPRLCEEDDAILVTYTNTDGRTYRLRISARLA